MARYELEYEAFWTGISLFTDWDYQYTGEFQNKYYRNAVVGIPAELDRLTAGLSKTDHYFQRDVFDSLDWGRSMPPENGNRRYTNCCTFVASAVLIAAYRLPPERRQGFKWDAPMHQIACRWTADPAKWPPLAYIQAGLADPVPDWNGPSFKPRAKTIYVCQKQSHTFFVCDYDTTSDKVLFLEAAGYSNRTDLQAGRDRWWGGVGFQKIGRVLPGSKGPPADWATYDCPKWSDLKKLLKDMSQLAVRPAYPREVHLPFDPPKAANAFSHYYHLNEVKGEGGYYPVGRSHNFHGGIHLPLDRLAIDTNRDGTTSDEEAGEAGSKDEHRQPIRALGPGEVVAVRLGKGKAYERALDVAGNSNGFVLVRHRLELHDRTQPPAQPGQATPPPPQDNVTTVVVYVLYMHLLPIQHAPKLYDEVPWFAALASHANGALVNLELGSSFGERGFTMTSGTFGPYPGEGRVKGVRCAPEGDVAKARAALEADGKVGTFALPLLTVDAGDLLGFSGPVPEAHRVGTEESGFLHWEVLAPVAADGSDLQKLVEFAGKKLDGLNGVFQVVNDENADNVVKGGDLQKVAVGLLSTDNDGDRVNALREGYTGDHLTKELLRKPKPIAFAAPPENKPGAPADPPRRAGTDEALDYVVTVDVESYSVGGKCTVKTDTPLDLQFFADDDKDDTTPLDVLEVKLGPTTKQVRLRVPAGARALRVKQPEKLVLDLRDRYADKDRGNQEAAHLKRFATARWRGLLLRHPNEWHYDPATRTIAAHEETTEEDARPKAAAMAWWGGGAAHEVAMQGPDGKAVSLFGPDGLPAAADVKLDNVHPVTFSWVLDQLIGQGLLTFGKAAASSPTAAEVAWVGWLPIDRASAERRPVGEVTRVVAVARGRATTVRQPDVPLPVVFRATRQGKTVELGRAGWEDGVAWLDLGFPLWDEWKLDAAIDGQQTPAQPIVSATLNALVPVLAPGDVPKPQPQGELLGFRVRFDRDCPVALRGWVFVETRVAGKPGDFKPTKLGVPFSLVREVVPIPDGKKVAKIDRKDGFITSVTPPTGGLAGGFTYKDYCTAAGSSTTCAIAGSLETVVGALRDKLPARQKVGLENLQEGGCSVDLRWPNLGSTLETKAADLKKEKEKDRYFPAFTAQKQDNNVLRVKVPRPGPDQGAGDLVGSFAVPLADLEELLPTLARPGEEVLVRFGCVFANGRGPQQAAELESIDVEDLSRGGLVVRAAEESRSMSTPGFLPITDWGINEKAELWAKAQAVGKTPQFWKLAKPLMKVGDKVEPASRFDAKTKVVSVTIPLKDAPGTLTLAPTCTGTDLTGKESPGIPDGEPFSLSMTPAIEDIDVQTGDGGKVWLTARLVAWPPNRELKVTVLDEAGDPLEHPPALNFMQQTKSRANGQGTLKAWMRRASLPDVVKVRLAFAAKGKEDGVLGKGTAAPDETGGPFTLPPVAAERPTPAGSNR